jgi:toxin ParE1/3/4
MRVRWSARSLRNLQSTRDFISRSNPINAERFIVEMFDSVESRLKNFPKSGRVIPEKADRKFREIIQGNYRIMYKIDFEMVTIVTVRNAKQSFTGKEI